MRITIDGAGRLVVPKAIRDAMGLREGRAIEMVFTDGRIEIVAADDLPGLTAEEVRSAIEATRR